MPVINLPSGATITTFPAPPAGFDPTIVDENTLLRYGLPRRPVEHAEVARRWEKVVGKPVNFIMPTFRRVENKRHNIRVASQEDTTVTSNNWSGAVAFAPTGSAVSSVAGQWDTPTPDSASNDGTHYYSSFWIGIDGDGSSDVFQAGVECEAMNVGSTVQRNIYPWFEWFPENEVQITNFPVSPGDILVCLLTVISNTKGNVYLRNATTGSATAFQMSAPTGTTLTGNCAEWIAERPEVGGALTELANYGEVDFVSCSAHLSSGAVLQIISGDDMNMLNGSQVISTGTIQAPDTVKCVYSGPVKNAVPPPREQVDGNVVAFRAVDPNNVFVLGRDGKLWREQVTGAVPPPRTQVDANVLAFQSLDLNTAFVLGTDRKLWREQVTGAVPPPRVPVDANVFDFQAIDLNTAFVLGTDRKLWREQVTGAVPPPRVEVDANVLGFRALDANTVFVLGTDRKLWREQVTGAVPPPRIQVDGNVLAFQPLDANTVFVLGTDRKLWREQVTGAVPPPREQVDANVLAFQALSAGTVFVLGTDGNLWLEQVTGAVPPPRVQVDGHVLDFEALDVNTVFVLGSDRNLWREHGPF